MAIEIEAPDGSVVEFPEGTPDETISAAMRKAYPPALKGADYAKGLARNVGQGLTLGAGDEITAAIRAGFGALTGDGSYGDLYDQSLGEERASIKQFASENPGTAFAANIGGALATAPIMPLATVAKGVGAVPGAINMGANALGYGAAAGFASGEGGAKERVENAVESGINSAVIAGPIGGVIGRIGAKATPAAQDALAGSNTQQIAQAAERLGVNVPRAAATNRTVLGNAARGTAGAVQAMPIIGAPLQRASQEAVEQIDDLGKTIADKYAVGATRQGAGETIKEAGRDWIKSGSSEISRRLYGEVEKHLAPFQFPLRRTSQIAAVLTQKDAAAASSVNAPAVKLIEEAVTRPGGLTYQGLLDLRTNVGAMIDDGLLPNAGTMKPALKRIYAALTEDLQDGIRVAGGDKGLKAWEKANRVQRQIAERRADIAKVIGRNDAAKSPEAIVESIVGMAGNAGGRADVQRLLAIRKTVGPEAWDELSAAAIGRLGQGRDGNFNPIDFLKNYQKLSDNGRNALFSSTGKGNLKQALDDLATVSNAYRDMQGAIARGSAPTNTALALGGFGYGAGVLPALALALKGNLFARIMAQPVRVKEVTALQRAMLKQAEGGNPNATRAALSILAKGIADETGEDERTLTERLRQALEGM